MKSLVKAFRIIMFCAGVMLPGALPAWADSGNREAAASAALLARSSLLLDYQNYILTFLMGAIALFIVLYIRQRHEYVRRTIQLENLISARTQELEQVNADLKRLSITDHLTGVKNRRFVEISIAEEMARIRRLRQNPANEWGNTAEETSGISFLMIDIDFFKRINDRYGHPAGDQVLRQMSSLFTSMVRESDTIVRWGGEEFLVIARNPRIHDTAILAERLRKRVASYPFVISAQQAIRVTCSIGFASWPFFKGDPDSLDWKAVVELADRGLYRAKENGRNAWCGLLASPDYKGEISTEILDDTDGAARKGIIIFQSSYDSIVGSHAPAMACDMTIEEIAIPPSEIILPSSIPPAPPA